MNIMIEEIRQECPDLQICAVLIPYTATVEHLDDATQKGIQDYWQETSGALPEDIFICVREEQRQHVEGFKAAYARHPIYGGVFLFLLGTAMIVDSVLGTVLALGLLPFFYLKSTYEERQLRIRYPEYHSYQQRVPRRLIPFVF